MDNNRRWNDIKTKTMEYEHKDKNGSFLQVSVNKEKQVELYIQNEDRYLFHFIEVDDIDSLIEKLRDIKSEIIKEKQ